MQVKVFKHFLTLVMALVFAATLASVLSVSQPGKAYADSSIDALIPDRLDVCAEDENLVLKVSWCLPASEQEGSSFGFTTGRGIVDHFNVYCDGLLVAQLSQAAIQVKEDERTGAVTGYFWECRFPVRHANQYYTVKVTAVDDQDNESDSYSSSCVVWDDQAVPGYRIEYENGEVIISAISGPSFNVYRDDEHLGTAFRDEAMVYDGDVEYGQTYTYTLAMIDNNGRDITNGFSVDVTIPDEDDHVILASSLVWESATYDASSRNGSVELSVFTQEGYTYRLYRNGRQQELRRGNGALFTFARTDQGSIDNVYKIERVRVEDSVVDATIYYYTYSNYNSVISGMVPDAPSLYARVQADAVYLYWEPADGEQEILGYYVFETAHGDSRENIAGNPLGYAKRLDVVEYDAMFSPLWAQLNDNGQPASYTYYVCAYNEWGMSEPSQTFTFTAVDGQPPVEEVSVEPYNGSGAYLVTYKPAATIEPGCMTCNGHDMLWLEDQGCWVLVVSNALDEESCFGFHRGGQVTTVSGDSCDINGNGVVTIADAVAAFDFANGVYAVSESDKAEQACWLAADIDGDLFVDAKDAYAVLYAVVRGHAS